MKRKQQQTVCLWPLLLMMAFALMFAASGSSDVYTIGLIGPISASNDKIKTVMGGAVAFQMVNNHSDPLTQALFPGIDFTINFPIFDDGGNPSKGIDAVFKMAFSGLYDPLDASNVLPLILGLVGPGYSSVSKPVSLLASVNNIPLISYSATSAQLSAKNQYPNFGRVVPSDDEESKVVGAFVKSFGWEEVIIFSCDDDFCTGYADSLLKQRFDYGYEVIASTTFPVTDHEFGGEYIKEALKGIKDLNCRIILMPILPMHVKYIHQYMEEMGMYSDDDDSFVWITPMGTAVDESQDLVTTKRGGHLAVQYRSPFNNIYEDGLKGHWDQTIPEWTNELAHNAFLNASIGKTEAELDAIFEGGVSAVGSWGFTPYCFDAALVFVKAIYDLRAEHGSGTEITSEMILAHWLDIVDFEGATGPISFTENLDRLVQFELVNLQSDGETYLPVKYWAAADPNDAEADPHGTVTDAENEVYWSSTMHSGFIPSHSFSSGSDEGMSNESLVLISIGSVAGLVAFAFFIRYLMKKWRAESGEQRYDPNHEHRKSLCRQIVKSVLALCLEIGDYVTDIASAANVFNLYQDDVIPVGLVVFYLMVLSVGAILNFGNMLWRSRNFLEMVREYTQGVSISAAAVDTKHQEKLLEGAKASHGRARSNSLAADIDALRAQGSKKDIKTIEDLTVKIVNATRQMRIEKFTFVLGLMEDLPIAIMNSILMMQYMDDINFPVIYFSTLTTLLEFGVKTISLEKVFMLNMRLKVLRGYVDVQRKYSLSGANHLDDEEVEVEVGVNGV